MIIIKPPDRPVADVEKDMNNIAGAKVQLGAAVGGLPKSRVAVIARA
jgi:hypothetical protein